MKDIKREPATEIDGKLYAILWAKSKKGYCETERCMFCGKKHIHSPENGHRVKHCYKESRVKTSKGWVDNNDGYIVFLISSQN